MGDKPRSELLGGLRSLYQSRDYADLIIACQDGTKHPVHRAIVCPRSDFFERAVKNGIRKNTDDGELIMLDDDPEVVRLLVEYLYLLDYEPLDTLTIDDLSVRASSSDSTSLRAEAGQYLYGTSAVSAFGGPGHQAAFNNAYRSRGVSTLTVHAIPEGDIHGLYASPVNARHVPNRKLTRSPPQPSPLATAEANLVLHASMYSAGHKYKIDGLKALALDKFKIQLTRHWDSEEFAEAIHVIYESTPPSDKSMREAVADALDWHGQLLEKPEIEFAIMEINGLAYELLKRAKRTEPEFGLM